jgi:N-formylglutamate amidohydrolase
LVLASATTVFAQTNLTNYMPGTTYWGRSNYTEYIAGNLPLIISAPHGGDTNPYELPNRTNTSTYTVTTDPDLWTANLARAIRTAAFNRYGRYPHVVICRVDRAKVDCNREIVEGAQNNTNTQTLWREFHEFIQIARRSVSNNYGRGLYLDLHGHGHEIQRNEIGYDLSDSDLFKTTFSSTDEDQSTVRAMSKRSRETFTELVRSNLSLGALLEKRGYPCVPSPSNPNPGTNVAGVTNTYFNGGYNGQIYGTSTNNYGTIDAIQIECNYTNVRAKSASSTYDQDVAVRATFASNLIASLDEFFKYHLEMAMNTEAIPPASVNSFSDKTIAEDTQTSTSSITLASANSIFWGESSNTNIVESSSAKSSNTNAVDSSGFIFSGSDTSRKLVVRPRPNAFGSNVIVMVYQQATNGGVGTDWYYLTVTPVNDPPIFGPVTNIVINPGLNLAWSNPATDVESNALAYQLLTGPSGASIDAGSGTLTWRPTIAQASQSYTAVTAVTDNGTNALSATNTNFISVNAVQMPKVALWWSNSETGSGNAPQANLSVVEGQAGPDYILQASTDLQQWSTILTNTPASFPWLWNDTNAHMFERRFYRVRLGP